MNLSEKLQILRINKGLSQEELGEKLDVSRQAISKWESGGSRPDLNKLIALSELYNVTVDSLVKDNNDLAQNNNYVEEVKMDNDNKKQDIVVNLNKGMIYSRVSFEYEYKSKRTLFGLPLVHVNIGRGFKKAKGIIAVGNISYGLLSIGMLSIGVLSFGVFAIGLVSFAAISVALLLALGAISIGTFSLGAVSIGVFSLGALSIGKYSIGAEAIGTDIAVGDYVKANIAIGNKGTGTNFVNLKTSIKEINELIKSEYPHVSQWSIDKIDFFVENMR